MPSGLYKLKLEQGVGRSFTLTYQVNNAPVNITGWSAALQVKRDKSLTGTALISLDNATLGGLDIPAGTDGLVAVNFTAVQTRVLVDPTYYYDVVLIPPSGEPIRLLEGAVIVDPGVTS